MLVKSTQYIMVQCGKTHIYFIHTYVYVYTHSLCASRAHKNLFVPSLFIVLGRTVWKVIRPKNKFFGQTTVPPFFFFYRLFFSPRHLICLKITFTTRDAFHKILILFIIIEWYTSKEKITYNLRNGKEIKLLILFKLIIIRNNRR